jgi:two-component system OmpR family response regulator
VRILVVDDNRDSANALARLLQSIGHEVCSAYDGASALLAAKHRSPDAVIQELGMPNMSDCEVARSMRRLAAGRRLLLVALTGRPRPEALRTAMEAGFDRLLLKPVGVTALEAVLMPLPRDAPSWCKTPNRARDRETVQNGIDAPALTGPGLPDLVVCVSFAKTCAQSGVMLARVRRSGRFELLTASAWGRALGYLPSELNGKSLRELMDEECAATETLAALVDEQDVRPLEVPLRCKDERRKCFRLYRRFDPYEKAVFIVADEVSENLECRR